MAFELVTSEKYPVHIVQEGENNPTILFIRQLFKRVLPNRNIDRIEVFYFREDGTIGELANDPNVFYFGRLIPVFGSVISAYFNGSDVYRHDNSNAQAVAGTFDAKRFTTPLTTDILFDQVWTAGQTDSCFTIIGYKIYCYPQ